MDFIRNKKKLKGKLLSAVFLFYFGAALALSLIAKLCGLFCRLSFHPVQFPSFSHIRDTRKLLILVCILIGCYMEMKKISFGQFQEGELSVLHDEISKMTRRLIEQAEALKMEKGNLANALADISHQLKNTFDIAEYLKCFSV